MVNQLTQVLEQSPETDKLFIAAYLDVLLSPEFEQPNPAQKEVLPHTLQSALSAAIYTLGNTVFS